MKDWNLPSGRSTGGPSAEDDKGIRKKKWNSLVIAIDIKCYNVAKAARQLQKLKQYKKFTQQNYKCSTSPVVTKTRRHIEDLRPPCKETLPVFRGTGNTEITRTLSNNELPDPPRLLFIGQIRSCDQVFQLNNKKPENDIHDAILYIWHLELMSLAQLTTCFFGYSCVNVEFTISNKFKLLWTVRSSKGRLSLFQLLGTANFCLRCYLTIWHVRCHKICTWFWDWRL